jgi:jasmonate O-methyltransferase
VKLEVLNEGSFVINHLEVFEVNSNAFEDQSDFNFESKMSRSLRGGYNLMQSMRAVFEPLLISHFGEDVIEEVFMPLSKNLGRSNYV